MKRIPLRVAVSVRSHENVHEMNSSQIIPASRRNTQNPLRLDPPQRKEKV